MSVLCEWTQHIEWDVCVCVCVQNLYIALNQAKIEDVQVCRGNSLYITEVWNFYEWHERTCVIISHETPSTIANQSEYLYI